jgi:hypothetical protein
VCASARTRLRRSSKRSMNAANMLGPRRARGGRMLLVIREQQARRLACAPARYRVHPSRATSVSAAPTQAWMYSMPEPASVTNELMNSPARCLLTHCEWPLPKRANNHPNRPAARLPRAALPKSPTRAAAKLRASRTRTATANRSASRAAARLGVDSGELMLRFDGQRHD